MKTYVGQKFYALKTSQEEADDREAKAKYAGKDGVISLAVYCVRKGYKDPVLIAALRSYKPVQGVELATFEDWESLFAGF